MQSVFGSPKPSQKLYDLQVSEDVMITIGAVFGKMSRTKMSELGLDPSHADLIYSYISNQVSDGKVNINTELTLTVTSRR
jgi:hypothetical protein